MFWGGLHLPAHVTRTRVPRRRSTRWRRTRRGRNAVKNSSMLSSIQRSSSKVISKFLSLALSQSGLKKQIFWGGLLLNGIRLMMYFSIFHHDRQTEIRSAPLVEIWCESCVSGLGYELCARQSEDHVVEVDESTVTRCEEGLQQEACKELFKDSTK